VGASHEVDVEKAFNNGSAGNSGKIQSQKQRKQYRALIFDFESEQKPQGPSLRLIINRNWG